RIITEHRRYASACPARSGITCSALSARRTALAAILTIAPVSLERPRRAATATRARAALPHGPRTRPSPRPGDPPPAPPARPGARRTRGGGRGGGAGARGDPNPDGEPRHGVESVVELPVHTA